MPDNSIKKYLDYNGLDYFLDKLDDRFAVSTHVHGNLTNNGMLGTASKVVITDSSKYLTVSNISTTELGYLSGVTSNIQTQLNSKASSSDLSNYLPLTGGTLSSSNLDILTIKRTSSNTGAFIMYKNNNQEINRWLAGASYADSFLFQYSSNSGSSWDEVLNISPLGNVQLKNNITLQWKNTSGTYIDVLKLDNGNQIVLGQQNYNMVLAAYDTIRPVASKDNAISLGTSSYR